MFCSCLELLSGLWTSSFEGFSSSEWAWSQLGCSRGEFFGSHTTRHRCHRCETCFQATNFHEDYAEWALDAKWEGMIKCLKLRNLWGACSSQEGGKSDIWSILVPDQLGVQELVQATVFQRCSFVPGLLDMACGLALDRGHECGWSYTCTFGHP